MALLAGRKVRTLIPICRDKRVAGNSRRRPHHTQCDASGRGANRDAMNHVGFMAAIYRMVYGASLRVARESYGTLIREGESGGNVGSETAKSLPGCKAAL